MSMNSVSSNNTMAPLVVKKHLGDCRGRRFNPWSGKFHLPWGVAKEKEKKKGKKNQICKLKKKFKCCFFVSSASSGGLYSLCVEFCSPFSPLQSSSSQLLYPTSCYLPRCLLLYLSPSMTSVAITLDSPSSSKRVSWWYNCQLISLCQVPPAI